MYKATNQNIHFLARAGSFSTRPSVRGVNLLGWGEDEELTPEQQRDCLVRVVNKLHAQLKSESLTKQERKELGRQYYEVAKQINELRPKKKTPGVVDYVMDILREEMPRRQFDILMRRALERMNQVEGK